MQFSGQVPLYKQTSDMTLKNSTRVILFWKNSDRWIYCFSSPRQVPARHPAGLHLGRVQPQQVRGAREARRRQGGHALRA